MTTRKYIVLCLATGVLGIISLMISCGVLSRTGIVGILSDGYPGFLFLSLLFGLLSLFNKYGYSSMAGKFLFGLLHLLILAIVGCLGFLAIFANPMNWINFTDMTARDKFLIPLSNILLLCVFVGAIAYLIRDIWIMKRRERHETKRQ